MSNRTILLSKGFMKEEFKLNFINNPFEIVTEIIEELYPGIECDIYIGNQLTDGKETFGCTLFPDDKNEIPVIEVHYSLNLENATEVLVHELAHVIAGEKADHNDEWEKVFKHLHTKFQQKVEERFAK